MGLPLYGCSAIYFPPDVAGRLRPHSPLPRTFFVRCEHDAWLAVLPAWVPTCPPSLFSLVYRHVPYPPGLPRYTPCTPHNTYRCTLLPLPHSWFVDLPTHTHTHTTPHSPHAVIHHPSQDPSIYTPHADHPTVTPHPTHPTVYTHPHPTPLRFGCPGTIPSSTHGTYLDMPHVVTPLP